MSIPYSLSAETGTKASQKNGWQLFHKAERFHRQAKLKSEFLHAIDKYREALKHFEQLKDHRGIGRVHLQIGRIQHNRLSKSDSAKQHFERALERLRQTSDIQGQAIATNGIGACLSRAGKQRDSIYLFEKAFTLAEAANDVQYLSIISANLASSYYGVREYSRAILFFEKNAEFLKSKGDSKKYGVALTTLGVAYSKAGEKEKALEAHNKALQVCAEAEDTRCEGGTLINMGSYYYAEKNYNKALECYEKAAALFEQSKNRAGLFKALKGQGMAHGRAGRSEMAKKYFGAARQYTEDSKEIRALVLLESHVTRERRAQDLVDERIRELGLGKNFRDFAYGPIEKIQTCKGLTNQAYHHFKRGEHKKARQKYEKSLNLAEKLGYNKQIVNVLASLGGLYSAMGNEEKALAVLRRAVSTASRNEDNEGLCQAQNNLAAVYRNKGEFDKAAELYEQSLMVARRIGDYQQIGTTLNNLGELNYHLGQPQEAIEYYRKALATSDSVGDLHGVALVRYNLGLVCQNRAKYNEAISHFEKAIKKNEQAGMMPQMAEAMIKLASVYEDLGLYRQSLEYLKESSKIYEKINAPIEQQSIKVAKGRIYWQLKENRVAIKLLRETANSLTELGEPPLSAKRTLISVLIDEGELDEADKHMTDLVRLYKKIPNKSALWLIQGRLFLYKSQYKEALDMLEQARDSARENKNLSREYAALTGIGLAYEGLEDLKNAISAYDEALRITEDLRSTLTSNRRRQFFHTKVLGFDRVTAYEGMARALMKDGNSERALRFTEFTKARMLSERMSNLPRSIKRSVPQSILFEDERLTERVRGLTNCVRRALERGDTEAFELLEPKLIEAKERFNDFKRKIRERHKRYAAIRYHELPHPQDAYIADNEWLLVYDLTESGLLKYLLKGKDIVKHACDTNSTRESINMLVEACRASLRMESEEELEKWKEGKRRFNIKAAKRLANILLGEDVLCFLPEGSPVTIIPDERLGLIPFEMLVLKEGSGVLVNVKTGYPELPDTLFFGDRNSVRYRQSIAEITKDRDIPDSMNQTNKLLIIADPIYAIERKEPKKAGADSEPRSESSERAEPESRYRWLRETYKTYLDRFLGGRYRNTPTGGLYTKLNKINQKLDATNRFDIKEDCCLREKASKNYFDTMLKSSLDKYRWIIFGTHGELRNDIPGFKQPVLVLGLDLPSKNVEEPKKRVGAEDEYGYLTMDEVTQLKIKADLVALTACHSGEGPDVSGEGVMSMGTAFRYAGARSVLASLWTVYAETSVNLVTSLFKNLASAENRPKSKLEALQNARQAIRKSGYNHPYFWAAFILIGEDE
jgi:tetratricopeptide (TPR) repeat protein